MTDHTPAPTDKPPSLRWSFSQWENYDGCPARWRYASVIKIPRQPPKGAAARGLEIHASVEGYIQGSDAPLHEAVSKKYIPILDSFRAAGAETEKRMHFTQDWTPVPQSGAWCTGVLDACHQDSAGIVQIAEWKSGKPKPTHAAQRALYSIFGLAGWTDATQAVVTTYYLEDTEAPQSLVLGPALLDQAKSVWQERVALMARDQICAPRPGLYCRWCDYAKTKGGPCQFG